MFFKSSEIIIVLHLVLKIGSLELDMHNGSHSQKENRHVNSHSRVAERDREREGRRAAGY